MEAAVEVEVVTAVGCRGGDGGEEVDLDLEDDLSIGAEVTCAEEDSSVSGVSILEELLLAENGKGDSLACLQAASRSSIIRRVSYEEMVHHKPSLPSLSGGGFRETLIMLTQWVIILQELYDDNCGGGGGAEDSLKFVHGRLPEVSKCVCARAETLVEAVRGLEASINNCGGGDEDALAAACSLQNDLRLHVSILISDPGEEVRQKAAFMVESAAAESRPEQFVTDAADSLVRLLYKLMGVESCSRHILREDGAIILNPRTNSNQATLNDDNDDTKENDDDEMEVDREPLPSPPRFVISANPNPSSNKMKANKIPEMVPSRKRKPLSPKNNSQHVLNPSTEASTEEEGEEQPRLSQPPASAFAPSSAASLIRPSKRPRKVSPQAAADAGDFVGGNSSCNTNGHRSRVLELLERNRKAARSDGLYRFVLWREALRGATTGGGEATT